MSKTIKKETETRARYTTIDKTEVAQGVLIVRLIRVEHVEKDMPTVYIVQSDLVASNMRAVMNYSTIGEAEQMYFKTINQFSDLAKEIDTVMDASMHKHYSIFKQ